MKTFLEYVAEDIIRKYGTDLSGLTVVFPNKRARLFLNEALVRLAKRPVWSPTYLTISQLFRSQSELTVADPVKLVCDLHRSYTEVTGFDESLDRFYGWGQLLLTDFDDIDKHMVAADKVFTNLRDYREFDDVSYLSQEQREVIRKFFSNFSDERSVSCASGHAWATSTTTSTDGWLTSNWPTKGHSTGKWLNDSRTPPIVGILRAVISSWGSICCKPSSSGSSPT